MVDVILAVLAAGGLVVAIVAAVKAHRSAKAADRSADEAAEANRIGREGLREAIESNRLSRELAERSARERRLEDARSRLAFERMGRSTWSLCNLRNEPLTGVTVIAPDNAPPGMIRNLPEGSLLPGWSRWDILMLGSEEVPARLAVIFDGLDQPVEIPLQTQLPGQYVRRGNGPEEVNKTPWRVPDAKVN